MNSSLSFSKSVRGMVSVIIPTYNRAGMLAEAAASVFEQDCFFGEAVSRPYELIIVDDGSTDDTARVAAGLSNKIRFLSEPHRGVSAARNRGLQVSQGEFIAFLDSDDLWKKDKISTQMGYMEVFSDAVMCYTEEEWIRNGRFVNSKERHRKYSGHIFDKVLPLCLLSLSSALFRRNVFDEIGGFDEDLPACEDYDFAIRLAHRHAFHLIPKALIVKRGGHEDQLSGKYSCMDAFRIRALEKALDMDLSPVEREQICREILKKSRILHNGCLKRNKDKEAEKYAALIARYSG